MPANTLARDARNRLVFDLEIHNKHRTDWRTTDEAYVIDRYYSDGAEAVALALGRTTATIQDKAYRLRQAGRLKRPEVVKYIRAANNTSGVSYG